MGKISTIYVPSSGPPEAPLWVVGEAPGYDEERELSPFVGQAGALLREVMLRNGIAPDSTFMTNLSHYRPDNNDFSSLEDSQQLKDGLDEIQTLLSKHSPNCIALCGAQPLQYLADKKGILNWRGSIISIQGKKSVASLHPSYVLRTPDAYTIFDKDWSRINRERNTHGLNLPKRTFVVDPLNHEEVLEMLLKQPYLAIDIESVKHTLEILCIGFAPSPDIAYIIPWSSHYAFSFADRVLSEPSIKKIFHNGSFDTTMLQLNGIRTQSYTDDTIIQSHILDPELPRDLGFLTSIYTREPYYKSEGRASIPSDSKGWSKKRNKEELYIYNGKDCCVTYEIFLALQKEIENENLNHLYTYEMELVQACTELSIQGLLVDEDRLNKIKHSSQVSRVKYQIFLNTLAGKEINVRSTKELPLYLYGELKLPQRKSMTGGITANQEALVASIAYIKGRLEDLKTDKAKKEWSTKLAIIQIIMKLREIDKLLSSYLNITLHEGRAKSMYRVDGTESGRLSAKKFLDNSGLNIQTIPRSKVEIDDV